MKRKYFYNVDTQYDGNFTGIIRIDPDTIESLYEVWEIISRNAGISQHQGYTFIAFNPI